MTPDNFLGLPEPYCRLERAGVLVLPLPLEATVTYGRGTRNGPEAILRASQQVELYDREFGREVALEYGVHTLPALSLPADVGEAVEAITDAAACWAATGKLLVGLGGEHTVTLGLVRGILRARGGPLTVVQIDAHADLRAEYEGTPYSHACTARRLLETPGVEQVLPLGVRSICPEEVEFAHTHSDRVRVWYAEEVHAGDWPEELTARLRGRAVYLTIDVDGLDPAVIPATGTPEPDGLTWKEAVAIIRVVASTASAVMGIDCVELAPVPGLHAAEFAAAKLVYKAVSYALLGKKGSVACPPVSSGLSSSVAFWSARRDTCR
ncbi:MAG: agmatinase [Anaerolineae bacterium]|nr:agmatinase [Anaerolineae bacterium]